MRHWPPMGRIRGLDLARAVAILGMFAAHIRPRSEPVGVAETLYSIPYGRASILFGVVAGVGVSLLAASRTASPGRTRASLLWRAAVLLPLGLLMQVLDHGVFVILADYALLFVLAILLVGVGDRWLLCLAIGATFGGAIAYRWGMLNLPVAFAREAVAWGDPIGQIAHGLVLSGPYPLLTWAGPFAFGMWLGRRDLRAARIRWAMLVGGAATVTGVLLIPRAVEAVAPGLDTTTGWAHLLDAEPHSQTPAWLIGSTAAAVLTLALCVLAADHAPRVTWPLVATGQLAFTIYVAQLLALHLAPDALRDPDVAGALLRLAGFAAVSAVFAFSWRMLGMTL